MSQKQQSESCFRIDGSLCYLYNKDKFQDAHLLEGNHLFSSAMMGGTA